MGHVPSPYTLTSSHNGHEALINNHLMSSAHCRTQTLLDYYTALTLSCVLSFAFAAALGVLILLLRNEDSYSQDSPDPPSTELGWLLGLCARAPSGQRCWCFVLSLVAPGVKSATGFSLSPRGAWRGALPHAALLPGRPTVWRMAEECCCAVRSTLNNVGVASMVF